MCVSNHLLKLCEEFFEEISPNELEENIFADDGIEELRDYLAEEVENGGDGYEADLIENIRTRLNLIWSRISRREKGSNPHLPTHYTELQEHLDFLASEYVTEESESWKEEYLIDNADDDFYCDEEEFDDDESVYDSPEDSC